MRNLSKEAKITLHSTAVAAGATAITPSNGIDMAGFDGCIFIVTIGTITAGAVTSIEVHQSSDDGDSDSYTAIAGTNVAIADDEDNKIFYVDVINPRERYLKLIVNRATQNAVLNSIVAIQYKAGNSPVAHDVTVIDGELHINKAEGSA